MLSGVTYTFDFDNLLADSVYEVYYTYANEYPLRPIFYGGVQSQHIFTTNFGLWMGSLVSVFLLAMVLMF